MFWQESTKIRLVVGLVASGILIVSIGLTKGWQVFGSLVPTFAGSTPGSCNLECRDGSGVCAGSLDQF